MIKKTYFAGGCFWCTESIFQRVRGVSSVIPGYMGGSVKKPAYREVCSGKTGHTETIRINYDDSIVSFEELLLIFFLTHDPTTMNRQGNDIGTQYRSGAYYFSETQKLSLLETKALYQELLKKAGFGSIVTEIKKTPEFFLAEDYHQQYLAKNPQGYCGLGGTGIDLKKNLENSIEAF